MAMRAPTQETTYTLKLAPNFTPEANEIIRSNGVACFGQPGSGKSNMLALLAEQYSQLHLPLVLLDTEGEYTDLLSIFPRGILCDRENLPDAHLILHEGKQCIFNLKSWDEDYEAAALAMVELVEGLFRVAGKQSPVDRVPCPVILDEAATWLPRQNKRISHLSKATRTLILTSFTKLGSRGRKFGLVSHLFTQYVSQIDGDVVRQCATKVLMRATDPRDLKKYAEFLPLTRDLKQTIMAFAPGEALVLGHDKPFQTRFYEQQSDHPSNTPRVEAALVKFNRGQGHSKTPPQSYGHAASVLAATQRAEKLEPRAKVLQFPTSKPTPPPDTTGPSQTLLEQAFRLLDQDEDLNPYQLSNNIGCSTQTAAIIRQIWLEKHPEYC